MVFSKKTTLNICRARVYCREKERSALERVTGRIWSDTFNQIGQAQGL